MSHKMSTLSRRYLILPTKLYTSSDEANERLEGYDSQLFNCLPDYSWTGAKNDKNWTTPMHGNTGVTGEQCVY